MKFKKNLHDFNNAISLAIKNKIDLKKPLDKEKAVYDYDEKQRIYYYNNLQSKLKILKSDFLELPSLIKYDIRNQAPVNQILEMVPELESEDLKNLQNSVKRIITLAEHIDFPEKEIGKKFSVPDVPDEIKPEIKADIDEMNKCYNNKCYRSTIILCGRILETALHRKYYEVTGNDLLEKSPGIGLGNIIAKLRDKNVALDPAVTNQIHLINQVRIFSVHKKKQAFHPSEQQTQAAVLYTLDIVEKLF